MGADSRTLSHHSPSGLLLHHLLRWGGTTTALWRICAFTAGPSPEGTPEEYQAYIQEMRDSFVLLDAAMQTVEGQMEDGDGLDDVRVKAVFFALYFGADDPAAHAPGRPLWIALSPMRSAPAR